MANTRKNRTSRKNRKENVMAAPVEEPVMRKQEGGKRKAKGTKKRQLSPALKEWNKRVMEKYREMKAKNPETKLRDAMKAAKRDS
jgi:stalled ribosome alternative rescue factor ArfA